MQATRYPVTMNNPRRRPSRRRKRRSHLRPVDATATTHRTYTGTVTAGLAAVIGFSLVLVLGRWASLAMGSGDSFGGLAIAAATMTIFAPMGALVAALAAAWPYRRHQLSTAGRRLLLAAMFGSWGITILVFLLVSGVAASTALILQTAVLVVARVALIELAPPALPSPLHRSTGAGFGRRR